MAHKKDFGTRGLDQHDIDAREAMESALWDYLTDLDIKAAMEKTAQEYLTKALTRSDGNMTKAAKMLGLPNYQTAINWCIKYKVPYRHFKK